MEPTPSRYEIIFEKRRIRNLPVYWREEEMRLKDKVAIITGGGSGIGRAISLAFASEGAIVAVAARTFDRLEEVANDINSRGGTARAIAVDVADEIEVQEMVARTLKEYGRIDILVNNAGIPGLTANIANMQLDKWNEVLSINLTGPMLCSREVLANMIGRKSGSIINISSVGGMSGFPMRSPYCVSKMGIIGLTETMAIEVGDYNIRVNCISPGAVRGDRVLNAARAKGKALGINYEEVLERLTKDYSLKRLIEPTEIASAAVFLASDDASAITGHTLVVSCGLHISHY
jgi:NAD(P)-dependent dehydrogenase (short-subunit alcohol dehydrogenase family)